MEAAADAIEMTLPPGNLNGLRDQTARPASLEEMPDADIVRAVLGGESRLFEQIVYRYERAIYRHIYRMARNVEDAEDLTQDTFVKAYRGLKGYREAWPFKPWLFRIATNATISALRKRRPHKSLDDPGTFQNGEGPADPRARSPRSLAAVSETMRRLKKAVAELSPLSQAVFNLRYTEEMKIEEIARTLGRRPGAVAVMLHRVRERLSNTLFGAERSVGNGGHHELQPGD